VLAAAFAVGRRRHFAASFWASAAATLARSIEPSREFARVPARIYECPRTRT
jgi:hypothetical protein